VPCGCRRWVDILTAPVGASDQGLKGLAASLPTVFELTAACTQILCSSAPVNFRLLPSLDTPTLTPCMPTNAPDKHGCHDLHSHACQCFLHKPGVLLSECCTETVWSGLHATVLDVIAHVLIFRRGGTRRRACCSRMRSPSRAWSWGPWWAAAPSAGFTGGAGRTRLWLSRCECC
jgi:hypothetical protein